MPEEIRLWEVTEGQSLRTLPRKNLNLEDRLEDWLEHDVSIISDDLLVIGRQIRTDFGGIIDLLCVDSAGDLTVVELKRGKTPREVVSQLLEYAAWAQEQTASRIVEIFNGYSNSEEASFAEVFTEKFEMAPPENLNTGGANMLLVAAAVDEHSERIVRFLSSTYGVRINAATFNYFVGNNSEMIARVFLLEPEQVEQQSQTKGSSKRMPTATLDDLGDRAERKGVGSEFKALLRVAENHGLSYRIYPHSLMYSPPEHRNRALFTVSVGSTATEEATITAHEGVWQDFYPVSEDEVRRLLGDYIDSVTLTNDTCSTFLKNLSSLFEIISEKS